MPMENYGDWGIVRLSKRYGLKKRTDAFYHHVIAEESAEHRNYEVVLGFFFTVISDDIKFSSMICFSIQAYFL